MKHHEKSKLITMDPVCANRDIYQKDLELHLKKIQTGVRYRSLQDIERRGKVYKSLESDKVQMSRKQV